MGFEMSSAAMIGNYYRELRSNRARRSMDAESSLMTDGLENKQRASLRSTLATGNLGLPIHFCSMVALLVSFWRVRLHHWPYVEEEFLGCNALRFVVSLPTTGKMINHWLQDNAPA